MLEEQIELLLCLPVLRIELVNVVIRYVKRLHIPFRLYNPCIPVSDGLVQQPVADKVYQPVGRHTGMVFREKMRMLLDKGNDVIRLLLLRFETTFPLLRDNEFVVADAPPLAVQPDI